ncbi:MAG: HAMP domain-containing histidine kinase [Catenulispora sp.]|nr:HAMP domain-containing histidine kinase [Catenulispora sp.]
MRLTGLRMRLLAAFAAVALLTSAAVTGVSYVLTRQSLMTRINETSVQQFEAAVNQYKQQLADADADATSTALRNLAGDLQIAGGNDWVVYKDQTRLATTNDTLSYDTVPPSLRTTARKGVVAWQRAKVDGQPFLILGSSLEGKDIEIYDFVSLQPQQEDLNRLAQNSGIASAVAIAISLALGLLASRGVLLPLRRLGIAARRLGSGKLDTRVEVRGNDEVADVSRTFNETADALERSIAELRSLEASSRRFVADVSHELRTPLTAMTAVTDLLEEATDVGDESAPAAQLIVNETRRLARLVEDLMEVSRFDAGTAQVRLEEVDLVALVHGCLDARGWTGRVTLHVPESLPIVVDQRRIDVIVANMVGNAIKHGGEGPVELFIGTSGTNLLLQVRDHGPGIPKDALEHIFERFYKADKARGRSEGSGLGLSIAYENAHVHGGELTGANHPEGGAVFTLRLPVPEPGGLA